AGICALALRKGVKNPFPMKNDEVSVDTSGARPAASPPPASGPAPTQAGAPRAMDPQEIRIEFDGIETRVARVPIEADNISRLIATKTALLYVVNGAPYYSRQSERRPVLTSYSLKDRRATVVLDNAGNFAMSRDQKKLI